MFNAVVIDKDNDQPRVRVMAVEESALPAGNVRVAVAYSSLNYKDGLALSGNPRIVRQWPLVPGIDFAGTVQSSSDARYQVGDQVILTGWGVGEQHWGGLAEMAQVDADWLVPMPTGLDSRRAMAIGTAGLTSMLCVQALLDGGLTPAHGEILVTGAAGGVGSVAVALLAALGFKVAALTGRVAEQGDFLRALGATRVLDRSELQQPLKPLEAQVWAGVVDTVGSHILAKALAQSQYGGVVAACGLAGGVDLPTNVMPFILRNVRLQGIDSVYCPLPARQAAWTRLSELLPASFYAMASTEIGLAAVPAQAAAILRGEVAGRTLVKLG
ncbi:MAG: MDR family oxidoreductase [Aeromonas sp.]